MMMSEALFQYLILKYGQLEMMYDSVSDSVVLQMPDTRAVYISRTKITKSYEENIRILEEEIEKVKYARQWDVPSSSSSKTYKVSLDNNGSYSCSCLAWTRQRKECRHIKSILGSSASNFEAKKKEPKVDILAGIKANAKWSF